MDNAWPERPNAKWPSVNFAAEFECLRCKKWKPSQKYMKVGGQDYPRNNAEHMREQGRKGVRWACLACFIEMGLETGLCVSQNNTQGTWL